MSLSQSLQQKLLQKLSPQQIQLMKLRQWPIAIRLLRIKEELEENPALEETADDHEDGLTEDSKDEFENTEEFEEKDGSEDEYENIDISEYVNEYDDDVADYKLRDDNYPELDEDRVMPHRVETSFHELLLDQLGMLVVDDRTRKIAEQIVGSIDDDGYLRRETASIADDLAFRQNIETSEQEIESLIKKIQRFDPPGVASRDLQECLLNQLNRKKGDGKSVEMAIDVLTYYFDEFTKKHYDKIQRGLNLTDDQLKDVINQIIKLNPKPGGDISEVYKEMLKEYDRGSKKDKRQKEAVLFIKQKIDAAKWFIDAIKQRQQTLYNTMHTIMDYQHDFFLTGDETTLRPMILKDIAERTALDISTVSRVANSKFVQTEFGTYRLKFFFSESLSTDSGEEVSTREVKKILSDLIEGESKKKPLSDERLTELLQEKGYNIARRTVAKYREQLNIPVARLRREL